MNDRGLNTPFRNDDSEPPKCEHVSYLLRSIMMLPNLVVEGMRSELHDCTKENSKNTLHMVTLDTLHSVTLDVLHWVTLDTLHWVTLDTLHWVTLDLCEQKRTQGD